MNEWEAEKESSKASHPGGDFSSPHLEILKGSHRGRLLNHGFDLPVPPFMSHSSPLKIE